MSYLPYNHIVTRAIRIVKDFYICFIATHTPLVRRDVYYEITYRYDDEFQLTCLLRGVTSKGGSFWC